MTKMRLAITGMDVFFPGCDNKDAFRRCIYEGTRVSGNIPPDWRDETKLLTKVVKGALSDAGLAVPLERPLKAALLSAVGSSLGPGVEFYLSSGWDRAVKPGRARNRFDRASPGFFRRFNSMVRLPGQSPGNPCVKGSRSGCDRHGSPWESSQPATYRDWLSVLPAVRLLWVLI